MKNLALLIFVTVISIPIGAWSAFVVIQLWNWFVVPAFGIPAPSLWLTAGLLVLIRYATMTAGAKTAFDDLDTVLEKAVYITIYGTLPPALVLLSGSIFHLLAGV